ncbi:MAG: sensor histidine kinase [Desulfuromonadales bacterium]
MNMQWQAEPIPPSPLRTVLVYALFGAAWIFFSDLLLAHFVPIALYESVSMAKGLLFIAVTALVLGLLLRRYHYKVTSQERRLREIIDNLPSYFYVFDCNGKAVLLNRALSRLFGVTPDEAVGKDRVTLGLASDVAAEHRANDLWVIEMRQPVIFEEQALQSDGFHTYLSVKFPLLGRDGSVEAVCGLSTDITMSKRAEKERQELMAELAKRNGELERFTYTVSHDLKSPLVTILGFIGQLEQDLADDEPDNVKADLAFISNAANQMRELLDSLLNLSRAGRTISEPQPIDLPALVQDVLAQLDDRLASARLQVELPTELPVIMGDSIRLREVFQNLLENAAKFTTDQPGPCIEIGCAMGEGELVCHVRDNGIGIPAEYQEKVFGLFEKLDPAAEGTGIGLAIVRRIVEEHGGRVWVESAGKGAGSTFFFTLPAGDRQ